MVLLKLAHPDGLFTRMSVGVDGIGHAMAAFFFDLGLGTSVTQIDRPIKVQQSEAERAQFFMKEWREHGKTLTAVK